MPVADLVIDLAVRYGFQVLGAILILAAGAIVARWAGRLVDRRLQKQAMEPPMRILMVRVLRIIVMLFAVVVALDKFGFQIAPLVAGIGVAGIGIGFALQGVLSNVIAGLTIIFTKPFRVGEYVELLGVHGDVVSIELFSTTLRHPDRSRVVIPNRKIVGEILHNFGAMRQAHLTVTVPHDADLARALAVAAEVVGAHPRVLKDPTPLVGVAEVSETGITLGVHPWVPANEFVPAGADVHRALVEALRAGQIPVGVSPRPIRLLGTLPAA